jgi:hypothetical protein
MIQAGGGIRIGTNKERMGGGFESKVQIRNKYGMGEEVGRPACRHAGKQVSQARREQTDEHRYIVEYLF